MKLNKQPIASGNEIIQLAQVLSAESQIAFDTEFIRETTFFPNLAIIQIATSSEAWLVDVLAFKGERRSELDPLLEVFRNPKVLKIVHAAQADQECLYISFGMVAVPTLDTSMAASLCGYGDSIGLANLLHSVLKVKLKKGHARTDWTARPLPKQLVEYALNDVVYLVELGQKLLEELESFRRKEWAFELSSKYEDKSLYESNPEAITRKLAQSGKLDPVSYSILQKLVTWREIRVRELDVPRRWLAGDGVLMDLARTRPKDFNHLMTFRGLNRGEIKKNHGVILQAIKDGENVAEKVIVPRVDSEDPSTTEESRALVLLRCFVGTLADQNKIALKHLVEPEQLLPLLRSKPTTVEELVKSGVISPSAAELMGGEIIGFLNGERFLYLDGTQVGVKKD